MVQMGKVILFLCRWVLSQASFLVYDTLPIQLPWHLGASALLSHLATNLFERAECVDFVQMGTIVTFLMHEANQLITV